jgi:transcriptional regulator with XRE-family HTH domain
VRTAQGLSQLALERRSGVHDIPARERGDITTTVADAYQLAATLGVPLLSLLPDLDSDIDNGPD